MELIQAAKDGNGTEIIKLLNKIRRAEDISEVYYTDSDGLTCLHTAIKYNRYEAT